MEESPFAFKGFLVERVLDHLETEELLACAEVNRLWQSVALSLLRRKLISVSVRCAPDSERAVPVSALGSSHVCVDIFCSKFARYRNIARLAGLRPSLVFLSYHADLNEDKRILSSLLDFLPPDSVIVYCKLELARTMYDDVLHEGIFGEFLFSADEERPSTSAAPLQFPWAHGYRQASAVGGDGGAVFRNVLPGVLVFKSLRVTEANIEGNAVTSHFVKEATEKTVQITSATVFGGMSRSQLDPFIRRLSEQFGSTDGTIAMAFPRNQDEALGELEAFERCFPSVPALANQATEFNVDGPFAPMSRLKLVLLLIKLLD
nr:uncharacterized protein LOC119181747 [Rhipicephalus microplus]